MEPLSSTVAPSNVAVVPLVDRITPRRSLPSALQSSRVAVLGVGKVGGEPARRMVMLKIGILLADRDSIMA